MIGALPGLASKDADDAVAGNYQDAEVSEQYREFDRRRGYRIEPTVNSGSGAA